MGAPSAARLQIRRLRATTWVVPRCLLAAILTLAAAVAAPAPASAASAFSFGCRYSHSAGDDPIVAPGRPLATHLHDFVGNTRTDAFSTPFSLRDDATTCSVHGDRTADRSAYWVPSLLQHLPRGRARQIRPKDVTVYYHGDVKRLADLPRGLRMISSAGTWSCGHGRLASGPRHPHCIDDPRDPWPVLLMLRLTFQRCWDGVNLDSPDHRSHMAHPGPRGPDDCPASHPVRIPQIRIFVHYPTAGGPDPSRGARPGAVELSSGGHESVHGDFMDGWDHRRLDSFVDRCIRHTRPKCDPAVSERLPARKVRVRRAARVALL